MNEWRFVNGCKNLEIIPWKNHKSIPAMLEEETDFHLWQKKICQTNKKPSASLTETEKYLKNENIYKGPRMDTCKNMAE